jgi:hypothetical protein
LQVTDEISKAPPGDLISPLGGCHLICHAQFAIGNLFVDHLGHKRAAHQRAGEDGAKA